MTPALVNRYTAKNMTLRCDHNPGVQTEISQVFRIRILKKSTSGWSLVAEQRDNENSPRVTGNLTASANVNSGVSGAFLQVSWLDVGEDNFGVYICEVLGFDISNRLASVPSLELDIHEFEFPTEYFKSLSKETHDTVIALKKTTDSEIPSLKKDIIGVHELVDTIHQNQSSILSQIDKFETSQSSLKSSVEELETRVSSMQSSLTICETKLNSLTQWPGGFYALLQPKTGCLVDLAFFGGTHKFHTIHTESQSSSDPSNDFNVAAFSPLTSFTGDKKNFVTIEFCEVKRQFNTAPWPNGSFCINKILFEPCPDGFTSGYVIFDTEDTDGSGYAINNVASRVINPTLHFCCEKTGSAETPIELPTSSPFLLYRLGGDCQTVQGMTVFSQVLQFNTEDSGNRDKFSGAYPDIDRPGSVIKFNMCYYF